jgi:hypothetical protein
MSNQSDVLKTFRVCIGHWELRVKAHNCDEAIAIAKKHLSRELPRLYDIIRNLTANRFQVENAA